jgi:hypothetical protein
VVRDWRVGGVDGDRGVGLVLFGVVGDRRVGLVLLGVDGDWRVGLVLRGNNGDWGVGLVLILSADTWQQHTEDGLRPCSVLGWSGSAR